MTRREMLTVAGSAPVWLSSAYLSAQAQSKPRLGAAPTAFSVRSGAGRRSGGQPFDVIEHCHNLGLAGVTANPPSDPAEIKKFRQRLEGYNMRLVTDARLPNQESEVPAFEAQVKTYQDAGAIMVHAAMTQRRYEQFDSIESFRKDFERCQKAVALAEPVLRKYRLRMAIENHKGWRSAEQAAWLKRVGSEWIGVCLDFGNNMALCEDPMETLRTLAPLTFFSHVKDMAVEEYEDGFLLSEVPMGEGILDLKQMVQSMRQKDPNMFFDLEMITRDPLKIPVFTDRYWAVFDESYSPLPGRDVGRILGMARKARGKPPLQRLTGMSPEAQLKAEDDNNLKCIAFAHANLDM